MALVRPTRAPAARSARCPMGPPSGRWNHEPLGLSPLGPYHSLMYGREMFFDVTPAKELWAGSATRSNDETLIESYDYYVTHREEILGRRGASHHRSPLKQGILRVLEMLP